MLRIGICDDQQDMRFDLRCKLERIMETRTIACEFYEFSSGERLLSWYAKRAGVLDLLFLDIEMDGLNGMDTAKALRANDRSLQLVFVTGHPDFVFDGYGVGALGYLMKPPAGEALHDIVQRAMMALHMAEQEVFYCRNGEGTYRIPKSSILYLSSDKRQVVCVTGAQSYTFYAKLDDTAHELGQGFVRIHQRHIVNAAAVEWVAADAVTVGGVKLPISRAYQKEAVRTLTRALLD